MSNDIREERQIDLDLPGRNMFGILPCPKCGGTYRWPTQASHPIRPNYIICDDCGDEEFIDDYEKGEHP